MIRWIVFERWVDEPQDGGRGWKPNSPYDSYAEAEIEYNRLRAEDKELGHKMNFAIEKREAE